MKPRRFAAPLILLALPAIGEAHFLIHPGKWEFRSETHIDGAPQQPPPFVRVMCRTVEEMQKDLEDFKRKTHSTECTTVARTAEEAPNKVHMKTTFRCAEKDFEGTMETTITPDFSETIMHGTMRGKTTVIHTTMKRLGDCN